MRIFVDTSAFVSRFHSGDRNHQAATSYLERVESGEAGVRKLYTSDYIVDEVVTTIFSRTGSFDLTKKYGEVIVRSNAIERLQIGEDTFERSWEFFKKRGEVGLSFTDATSAVLMATRGLDAIFTFDDDFSKIGLRKVP